MDVLTLQCGNKELSVNYVEEVFKKDKPLKKGKTGLEGNRLVQSVGRQVVVEVKMRLLQKNYEKLKNFALELSPVTIIASTLKEVENYKEYLETRNKQLVVQLNAIDVDESFINNNYENNFYYIKTQYSYYEFGEYFYNEKV